MLPRPADRNLIEDLKRIFAHKRVDEKHSKSRALYWEGDAATYIYGIEKGLVKEVRSGDRGKDWIVRLSAERELLGINELLDGQIHRTTALAVYDTAVWKIDACEFRRALSYQPDLASRLLRWMAHRFRDLEDSLELFSKCMADERIANLLIKMSQVAETGGDTFCRIPFRLTRQDIADMVGVTPETCSRTLSEFKRLGMIEEDQKRGLTINQPMIRAYFHEANAGKRRSLSSAGKRQA